FIDDIHGYDFVNEDGDPMDDNDHGTHVAGTIGAVANNGIGVAGVNWNVKLMALKFLDAAGSGFTSDAIRALNYAVAMGAQVSNNSWGGGGFSSSLYNAISNASAANHIFVAAAGNDAADNDAVPSYPANYDLPNVISVAATDRNDQLASFSNFGATTVDLAAPGVSILSTTPGNTYSSFSGTSMATPHVAGAISLVREMHPAWSNTQVINQILESVDIVPSLSGKVATGGRLNLGTAMTVVPVIPSIDVGDVSVTEGTTGTTVDAVFTLTLSESSANTVTVDVTTTDVSATAGSDYISFNGTVTFLPGETSKNLAITVSGDAIAESDETFALQLSGAVNATIADNLALATILNDDVDVDISVADVFVSETDSGFAFADFVVTLSTASSNAITVDYQTTQDSATEGDDYVLTGGTLTYAAGETVKTIQVPIFGDTLPELNETFFLDLSNPTNATLVDSQATGMIINNDPLVAASIGDISVEEGNLGFTVATFTVSLSGVSGVTVVIPYSSSAGTATSGVDYLDVAGSLSFAPGETSKTIQMLVTGDVQSEAAETFTVELANPTNATLDFASAEATILNDDTFILIGDTLVIEQDDVNSVLSFPITLSSPNPATVTVNYVTQSGSATSSSDFVAASGTVTFAPGETEHVINVTVLADTEIEGDETVVLNLQNPVNALLDRNTAEGNILNDDTIILIDDVIISEGNSGFTTALFSVQLVQGTVLPVSVDFATSAGTATNDFAKLSGTLYFEAGQTLQTVSVRIKGDRVIEADETFFVDLTNPVNALLGDNQGAGTIVDEDNGPGRLDGLNDAPMSVARSDNGQWFVTRYDANDNWITEQWGAWSPTVNWTNVQVGDVDGDGILDVAGQNELGDWWVGYTSNGQFVTEFWGRWNPAANWQDVQTADVNGDFLVDIVGRTASGQWWVGISDGSRFTNERWLTWPRTPEWTEVFVADFSGDGRADIAGRNSLGEWWVGESTGTEFNSQRWGAWSTAVNWRYLRVSDFDGDGSADILGQIPNGRWWIAHSLNGAFQNESWGAWGPLVNWNAILTGDVDGDGDDDLLGQVGTRWWLARSDGDHFTNIPVGATAAVNPSAVAVRDVDADGDDDVLWRSTSNQWLSASLVDGIFAQEFLGEAAAATSNSKHLFAE
ncbi:MAG: S8 family serine peptidase, partial [Planctomycetales bacterium]|nr:S8 family serine peptidase [Planctomycetales bacterium]